MKTCLVDLPSVDREDDGGMLIAHHAIFGLKEEMKENEIICPSSRLITESCAFPSSSKLLDGPYVLNLHLSPFSNTDAVPSRPFLHKIFNMK